MDDSKAFKELEIVQSIIHKQEELRSEQKKWCITIFAALTIPYLTGKIEERLLYLIPTILIIAIFYSIECNIAKDQWQTILRRNNIEKVLRNKEMEYDGPQIGLSFEARNNVSLKFYFHMRLFVLYVSLIILSFLMAFF